MKWVLHVDLPYYSFLSTSAIFVEQHFTMSLAKLFVNVVSTIFVLLNPAQLLKKHVQVLSNCPLLTMAKDRNQCSTGNGFLAGTGNGNGNGKKCRERE